MKNPLKSYNISIGVLCLCFLLDAIKPLTVKSGSLYLVIDALDTAFFILLILITIAINKRDRNCLHRNAIAQKWCLPVMGLIFLIGAVISYFHERYGVFVWGALLIFHIVSQLWLRTERGKRVLEQERRKYEQR